MTFTCNTPKLDNNIQMSEQCHRPLGRSLSFRRHFLSRTKWTSMSGNPRWNYFGWIAHLSFFLLIFLLFCRWHVLWDMNRQHLSVFGINRQNSLSAGWSSANCTWGHVAQVKYLIWFAYGQAQKYSPWHDAHFYAITGILWSARWKIMYSIKKCPMVRGWPFQDGSSCHSAVLGFLRRESWL